MKIWNRTSVGAAALVVTVAIAGCGEGSGKSASVAATTTAATTATTPTTTTPASTSTAAKPPAGKSDKHPSTTPAKTTTTPSKPPAAKTSTKSSETEEEKHSLGKIKLSSTAFKAGGPIAVQYTCDGAGTSPPLQWHGVPPGTAELFLLAIDLSGSANDAIQWAVAGIPASATSIPAGGLPAGAFAGVNSAGKVGWGGVCGAKGQLHHVGFLFYALKHKLGLKAGFNPIVARSGLKGGTLATGLTLATYQRR